MPVVKFKLSFLVLFTFIAFLLPELTMALPIDPHSKQETELRKKRKKRKARKSQYTPIEGGIQSRLIVRSNSATNGLEIIQKNSVYGSSQQDKKDNDKSSQEIIVVQENTVSISCIIRDLVLEQDNDVSIICDRNDEPFVSIEQKNQVEVVPLPPAGLLFAIGLIVLTGARKRLAKQLESLKKEKEERIKLMMPYQINSRILEGSNALVMHDMPIHRGYEISAEMIEAPNSIIYDQAENRLHSEKAILLKLLNEI